MSQRYYIKRVKMELEEKIFKCDNCKNWSVKSIHRWGGSDIIISLAKTCNFKCNICHAEYNIRESKK